MTEINRTDVQYVSASVQYSSVAAIPIPDECSLR